VFAELPHCPKHKNLFKIISRSSVNRTPETSDDRSGPRTSEWLVWQACDIQRVTRNCLSADEVVLECCRQRQSVYVRHATLSKPMSDNPSTQLRQRQRFRCTVTHATQRADSIINWRFNGKVSDLRSRVEGLTISSGY